MTDNAPGQNQCSGIGLKTLFRMFPNDKSARDWIETIVWPDTSRCPRCVTDNVQFGITHKSKSHRCRDCDRRPGFGVKSGAVMQSAKLGYQAWEVAAYLVATSLKSTPSMKLHKGFVHKRGVESFWSMLKRTHKGTIHKFSPKHLNRCVSEFAGRHNFRSAGTIEQMATVTKGMVGKWLRHMDQIADNGLNSGARS